MICFENTERREYLETPAASTEDVYNQTIGEEYAQEKRQIVLELNRYGIHALLTPSWQRTANTLNRYLELKARELI